MWSACQNAGYFSGGLAQYAAYPFPNLVKVPDSVTLEEAALAEPLACVVNGQSKIDVALGALPSSSATAHRADARADVEAIAARTPSWAASRRTGWRWPRQLGADVVVDDAHEDLAAAVKQVSDGRGADVAINAVGRAAVLKQAIDLAARRGQVLYFAATLQPRWSSTWTWCTTRSWRCWARYDSTIAQYEDALNLISKDIVKVEPLISHRLPWPTCSGDSRSRVTRKASKS